MLYFGVIFLVSIFSLVALLGRHVRVVMKEPDSIVEERSIFPRVHARPVFDRAQKFVASQWNAHAKPRALLFSEKVLHRCRLVAMKFERKLFELSRTIRRKNGELNGRIIPEAKNGSSDEQSRYNKYWDDLRKGAKKEE